MTAVLPTVMPYDTREGVLTTPQRTGTGQLGLLRHARHANVRFDRTREAFVCNVGGFARRVRGLHALMNRWHPTGPKAVFKRGAKSKPQAWTKFAADMARESTGVTRGADVHSQIATWMNSGLTALREKFPRPHSHTLAFIRMVRDAGVQPVLAEMLIYDEVLDVATAVDCVMWNPSSRMLEIWELKTGYDATFAKNSGKMRAPFDFFSDSMLDRAQLQILLTRMILRERYGIDAVARVVLVNHDEKGKLQVRTRRLATEVLARMPELYRACCRDLNDEK